MFGVEYSDFEDISPRRPHLNVLAFSQQQSELLRKRRRNIS